MNSAFSWREWRREQIEISTERDLLIISIVDEWRRHFIRSNFSATCNTPLPQGHS
jgi:hypothetical protein